MFFLSPKTIEKPKSLEFDNIIRANLVSACQYGHITVVLQAMENYDNFQLANLTDDENCSLLHWASINRRYEIVKLLLDCGANVDAIAGDLQETPLHWCCRNEKHLSIIVMLLTYGKANVNIPSIHGYNPLFVAIQNNCLHIAYILLSIGNANPNVLDMANNTPLHWLIKHRCNDSLDLQRLLLSYHTDILICDNQGNTILHSLILLNRSMNLFASFMIYEYCVSKNIINEVLTTIRNNQNQNVMYLVEHSELNSIRTFFFDANMYFSYPKFIPMVLSALLIIIELISIPLFGWMIGSFPMIMMFFIWEKYSQPTIVVKTSRQSNGFALGVIITIIGNYFISFYKELTFFWIVLGVFISFLVFFTFYLAITTPPSCTQDFSNYQLDEYQQDLQNKLLSNQSEKTKLCPTCLIDKSLATTHCAQCNRCVISLDHHCGFIDNCVGYGNRRIFLTFTLVTSLSCLIYVYKVSLIELTYCPYVLDHSYLYSFITLQLFTIWTGGMFINQLYLIGHETTTYDVLKHPTRRSRISCFQSQFWLNISHFFFTGDYKVFTNSLQTQTLLIKKKNSLNSCCISCNGFWNRWVIYWRLPRIPYKLKVNEEVNESNVHKNENIV